MSVVSARHDVECGYFFFLLSFLSIQGRHGSERVECVCGGLQYVSFSFVIRSVIPPGGSQMHSLFHTAAGLKITK